MIEKMKILLSSAIMAVTISSHAQDPGRPSSVTYEDLYVHNAGQYTIDNGLSSSFVTAIERDRTGMMWLGTNDGINTFDGYTFRNYSSNQLDSTTINGKRICGIQDVDQYTLYVVVADGGLSKYDRRTGFFSPVKIDIPGEDPAEFKRAYGVCRIADIAYVAYDNFIVKINVRTGQQTAIVLATHQRFSITNTERVVMKPMRDMRHICLLLSRTTLGILDVATDEVKLERRSDLFFNDICPLDRTHMYVCTRRGLYIYNIETFEMKKEEILGDSYVQSITNDYGIGYWIAYDNNHLLKWIPSRRKVRHVSNIGNFINKHTSVNSMVEDADNEILWLATSNVGLIKLDVKHPKIQNIDISDTDLPINYKTHDIFARRSHEIWAACGTDGVVRVDTKAYKAEHIAVPHRNVFSVYVRKNGDMLFGTTRGVLRYLPDSPERFSEIPVNDAIIDSAGRCIVNDMVEDCLGNMWFATQVGLYKYNGSEAVRYPSASRSRENVNVVYEDVDGRIWSGTESGSFVMEPGDTVFYETRARLVNFGDNNATHSFANYANTVLIGTSSGVLVYDKTTRSVTQAQFDEQFRNAMIYSIVCDDNGVIWISTNRGIGYIDHNYNQTYVFNQHDGLTFEGNECHKFAKYKNYIYIGNPTNLNFILANHINFNDTEPLAFVSNVTYGQSGTETQATVESDTLYSVRYLLRASLKVNVASSDFSVPSRNQFMYRIDNDEWMLLSGTNEILISGPMPGTYRIEIRAANGDKMWGDSTKTIYVEIIPPLWFSQAAIVFYIILMLTVTWFLIDIRFRTMKRRMKQIESEARAKKLVEAQRNRLAKLHKDQEDSIRYAKRIQESLMPPVSSFSSLFSKLFVFYQPKDIVSGDFYSFYQRDDKTFIIAADCTGHGVPGAFISILGVDHLYNIIMRQHVDDPGTILTYLHRDLHSTVFKRDNSNEEFNEGMDLTVCVVYHKEKKIEFAGAMNDLFLIRDNDILTFHGDRHSIGTNSTLGEIDEKQYRSHTIECQSGDMFYMFSDGFVDQFGGPEFKKFKHRRFKQLLLYIHKLPAKDQKAMLVRRFAEWKGTNDQTDDVSVVGFEPWS